MDVTIGSALDLFGGNMKFEDVLENVQKVRKKITSKENNMTG